MKNTMQKINPCLWFDDQAEEAVNFYTSIFENSKVEVISRYGKEGFEIHGREAGSVMTVDFKLNGQLFTALNGGPHFKFNPSISFFVLCETEAETDFLWESLGQGGLVLMPLDKYDWSGKYGWVQDKYGLSWQISLGKMDDVGQKFTPFLMFTGENSGRAREALDFYTSVFEGSGVDGILGYGAGENEVEGNVKHAQFSLLGQKFMVMESSLEHNFSFNEAISLIIRCETQDNIDYYWNKLTAGGEEGPCGWLKDKFGISWQVVPAILPELMSDPSTAGKVTEAFLQMKKLDIEALKQAAEGTKPIHHS